MDGESRSDREIEESVRRALEWALDPADPAVSCTVSNGQVTLEGCVLLSAQRAHIDRAVRILANVSCLFNRIHVSTAIAEEKTVRGVAGQTATVRRFDAPERLLRKKKSARSRAS